MTDDRGTPRTNDDLPRTIPLPERIDAALQRIRDERAIMSIPVDQTDVDVVLSDCKRELAEARVESERMRRLVIERDKLHNAALARANAAEKDAERYQWLRMADEGTPLLRQIPELSEDELDAAIDKALTGATGGRDGG
jgi:hypothetical protein